MPFTVVHGHMRADHFWLAMSIKRDRAMWDADTARVLMLLAQAQQHGHGAADAPYPAGLVAAQGRRVFECKTCRRQFPTFQALGGHRASHKRPRLQQQQQPDDHAEAELCLGRQPLLAPPPKTTQPAKPRVHECPVCGLEFAIGQALGGHMRRHRGEADGGETPAKLPAPEKACDGGICLDLNLTPSENCAKCRNVAVLGAAGQGVYKALAMLDYSL